MKPIKKRMAVTICVILLLPLLYWMPFWYKQWRYRQYFKARDICFTEGYSGNGSSWYVFYAYRCSLGYAKDPDPFPIGAAPASQSPEMVFVDIDSDGIPEIHVSGYDSALPGYNYSRYNEAIQKMEYIPINKVPREWKNKFPEDQN